MERKEPLSIVLIVAKSPFSFNPPGHFVFTYPILPPKRKFISYTNRKSINLDIVSLNRRYGL
jgi:hypothetical protein